MHIVQFHLYICFSVSFVGRSVKYSVLLFAIVLIAADFYSMWEKTHFNLYMRTRYTSEFCYVSKINVSKNYFGVTI